LRGGRAVGEELLLWRLPLLVYCKSQRRGPIVTPVGFEGFPQALQGKNNKTRY
jgi:hypothetical protein